MTRRTVFVVVLILAVSVALSAAESSGHVNAIVHPLDSSLYSDMDALYAMCGLVRPSDNRPWSDAEARGILDRVDRSSLTGMAASLYDRILATLDEGLRFKFGSDFQMDAGIEFGLEMYTHTNTEDFITEDDWVLGYQDRRSLMRVHFDFTAPRATSTTNGAGPTTTTLSATASRTVRPPRTAT